MIPAAELNDHLVTARVLSDDQVDALTGARWDYWEAKRLGVLRASKHEAD
jgi:hypothetical protein